MNKISILFIGVLIAGVLVVTGCQAAANSTPSSTVVRFPHASEPPVNLPQYSLAIYMDGPYPVDENVNYTKSPVTVTGWVNLTDARVTVNGVVATVLPNGNYYASILLKENPAYTVQSVATLGDKTDEMTFRIGVDSKGRMSVVPGLGGGGTMYNSRINLQKSVELAAGEAKTLDFTFDVKKDIRDPADLTFSSIYLRSMLGSNDRLPLPEGLVADINPQKFTVYPNTTYHSTLTINAGVQVTPGEYPLDLDYGLGNIKASGININVKVDPLAATSTTPATISAVESPWQGIPVYADQSETIKTKPDEEFILEYQQVGNMFPVIKQEYDIELVQLVDIKAVSYQTKSPYDSSTHWFLFKAIKSGTTSITIKHYTHLVESLIEQKVFNVIIN